MVLKHKGWSQVGLNTRCHLKSDFHSGKKAWDRSGTKLNRAWVFSTNFLFQFEPVIRKPDDKELKYFELFWSDGADNTRWKKVQSDPMLIFLSVNRLLKPYQY